MKKSISYIIISIIAGLVVLFIMIMLLNKTANRKRLVGKWYNYDSSSTGKEIIYEYKDCYEIELHENGTFEIKEYESYPFKKPCEDCVFGEYTIPNQWMLRTTCNGTYSFDGEKLILHKKNWYHHWFHTKEEGGIETNEEYSYNKDNHTLILGIHTYTTSNDYCNFDYIDPSGNLDEYKNIE